MIVAELNAPPDLDYAALRYRSVHINVRRKLFIEPS